MKSLQGACAVLVLFTLSFSNSFDSRVQGKCLNDQKALLLQLNQSLISNFTLADFHEADQDDDTDPDLPFTFSSKRDSWRLNSDCCSSWDGIGCDVAGRVISLDLSGEYLVGGLNSSSSLFSLQHLEKLNLADNHFAVTSAPIPSRLDQLANLRSLNLSLSRFIGQIPIEISRLTSLDILDLSSPSSSIEDARIYDFTPQLIIKDPDLETLTRNLTGLRELLLNRVKNFEQGNKWCRSLSSSLPKLQVLSLESCDLSGPLDSSCRYRKSLRHVYTSLLRLQSLRVLQLSGNNILSEIPNFLAEFPNLVTLYCEFCEAFRNLELSYNERLQGSLPEFPKDGRLQELVLSHTGFTGEIPTSIGNLRLLTRLDLGYCGFNGTIPHAISNRKQLQYLDLSINNFTGLIPSISWPESLTDIDLSGNSLVGPVPSDWIRLQKLINLILWSNTLNVTIPPTLFTLPSLQNLNLAENHFTGVGELLNGSFSQLEVCSYRKSIATPIH
ncbi:hypothetical protein MKX03_020394 [Papaver bracteatum]|nr:hypothetical protein MKX03_020394 [Papaver bracteatum]